jgi:A/G-specific adenine glycosylase
VLVSSVIAWFGQAGRDLPWRRPDRTPWGVVVSEVMLQQTPVARVLEPWRRWLERWPRPVDLAAASPAEVLRQWERLGYPRRALRLREATIVMRDDYDGAVPDTVEQLASLPGFGHYTAAAVAAFAFGRRAVVLDTNIRRLLARTLNGEALPAPSLKRAELAQAEAILPIAPAESVAWNRAAMELGSLVCRARQPACADCPVIADCRWYQAGQPADPHADRRRPQSWAGSDRQARGRIMAALRAAPDGVALAAATALIVDPEQAHRAITGLIADGLAVQCGEWLQLPS